MTITLKSGWRLPLSSVDISDAHEVWQVGDDDRALSRRGETFLKRKARSTISFWSRASSSITQCTPPDYGQITPGRIDRRNSDDRTFRPFV